MVALKAHGHSSTASVLLKGAGSSGAKPPAAKPRLLFPKEARSLMQLWQLRCTYQQFLMFNDKMLDYLQAFMWLAWNTKFVNFVILSLSRGLLISDVATQTCRLCTWEFPLTKCQSSYLGIRLSCYAVLTKACFFLIPSQLLPKTHRFSRCSGAAWTCVRLLHILSWGEEGDNHRGTQPWPAVICGFKNKGSG